MEILATSRSSPRYETLLALMNEQRAYPDSFLAVNKVGRPTMRGQRAHTAVATDRGIDLTLERNACLPASGCHFALRIFNRRLSSTKLV